MPRACVADAAEAESQPAAPLSPEETKTVMPSAAACCHKLFRKPFPEDPSAASHKPKLVLMTGARLWFTMYCADRSTPSLEFVDFDTTNLMVAFFAIAPDHSTSRSASVSSPELKIPGSLPLRMICGSFTGRPKNVLNWRTSASLMLERPTIAMD
jgi:hypothetical protein